MASPEQDARRNIDPALVAAGWAVQDYPTMNPAAARGVAVREFPLRPGHGHADYLLYADGGAVSDHFPLGLGERREDRDEEAAIADAVSRRSAME